MKDRVLTAVALAVFVALGALGVLAVSKLVWVGDMHVYVAGLNELFAHPFHPGHEMLAGEPGTSSVAFTPYLYLVTAGGALAHVDAYRAMQGAGLFNLVFYVAGLVFLMHVAPWSTAKNPLFAAACVAVVTLFMRNETFFVSSETSFDTLPFIIAYPSTFAWGCAFFAFGLVEAALENKRPWALAAIGALVWLTVTSHPLTGSWLLGICGLRALFEAWIGRGDRERVRRAVAVIVVVVAAFALSAAWPYAAFRRGTVVFAQIHPPFRNASFMMFQWLYVLAMVVLARLLLGAELRRAAWFAVGTFATFAVFGISYVAGIDYIARYVFFAAFFAQVLVGSQFARDVEDLASGPKRDAATVITAGSVLLAVVAAAGAPSVVSPRSRHGLPSPAALVALAPAHDRYLEPGKALAPYLSKKDVVMGRMSGSNLHLAAITGAHFVAARDNDHVASMAKRKKDTDAFFDAGTSDRRRRAILRRWHCTRVIADGATAIDRVRAIEGEPVWKKHGRAVFVVKKPPKKTKKAKTKASPVTSPATP